MKLWLWFVVMTILCWGAYAPTIREGQSAIGGKSRALWALLLVGIAYFVVACAGPVLLLLTRGDLTPIPSPKGAGVSILPAYSARPGRSGDPGDDVRRVGDDGAAARVRRRPIVATFIAMALHRPTRMPNWPFYVGIVMAAAGAAMVLRFKPS